jgi:hypothetical protein
MEYTACCGDLEKLIVAPGRKKGIGLTIVMAKWGTQFFVEYRNDWSAPVSEDGVQIAFCPFCGARLEKSAPD